MNLDLMQIKLLKKKFLAALILHIYILNETRFSIVSILCDLDDATFKFQVITCLSDSYSLVPKCLCTCNN